MSKQPPLPFDALRPFKNNPDDFTPRDTLPWEAQARQFLQCRTETGFVGLRSFAEIGQHIIWLVDKLDLPDEATILDIGCGPGLYSQRLAAHGYHLTGIDIAQPLLDYAQQEADKQGLACTYRRLSLLDLIATLDMVEAFDAVLLINTTINTLIASERTQALAGIRAVLKPSGHFIGEFSLLPPNFTTTVPEIQEITSLLPYSPWCPQFHALLTRRLTFPSRHERVTHYLLLPPGKPPREYWHRATLYTPDDLTVQLARHQLKGQAIFGETLGAPLTDESETCFVWATVMPEA